MARRTAPKKRWQLELEGELAGDDNDAVDTASKAHVASTEAALQVASLYYILLSFLYFSLFSFFLYLSLQIQALSYNAATLLEKRLAPKSLMLATILSRGVMLLQCIIPSC